MKSGMARWLAAVLRGIRRRARSGAKVGGHFFLRCYRGGELVWEAPADNLVPNVMLQHILDTEFLSGTPIGTWYLGLTNASPSPAAGDTMASHAGWTEFTTYSEGVRQTWTKTRSGQTVSNSASKAQFTVSTGGTIGGAFITSDNTKGGTAGTLGACAPLTGGNRAVVISDVVVLQYDFSAADDGV